MFRPWRGNPALHRVAAELAHLPVEPTGVEIGYSMLDDAMIELLYRAVL